MKKLRIVFGLSLAASVVAALAFVNNVVAIVRWWSAFLAAGGDTAKVASHAPGCFGWLDWSAVDYSAVTTLIPLIGFVCLAFGAWKLLRGKMVKAENFPFFEGSDQLHIALGLFGTLWGIIVIGYFKLDTVTMADLMQCLHTALFSTLMAVVWVFLIDRPLVRPYFRKLLSSNGLTEAEDGDLVGAVDRLVERLGAASDAFDRRQREYESAFEKRNAEYAAAFEKRNAEYAAAFEKRSAECAAEFEKRNAEYAAALEKRDADCAAALEKRSAGYAAEFEKRLAAYQADFEARQKEYVEFFTRRIAELKAMAEEADRLAAATETRLQAVSAALHS